VIYVFEDYALDTERQELRRGSDRVAVEPQVFDLLLFLVRNRARVVSKDDLIAEVWNGRIVSDSTLSSRITAVRQAIGDSGDAQRLIRTIARKGHRFVGQVREEQRPADASAEKPGARGEAAAAAIRPGTPERRQLTVMVSSVADTMRLSASLDPEDLREVMTACHRCIQDVVAQHGGSVAECTRDGAVAYFGYPEAHEEDAERAVRAGLEVSRAIGALHVKGLFKPLAARVGIATGLVVVDKGGNGRAVEAAAIGETPLLAARLASLAAPGTVVIASGTRHLLGGLFNYREIEAVELQGSAEQRACQVLSESGVASRFEALRSRRTRLIGRDEEIDLLRRRWKQVKETGQGRMVLVTGEPGIGKSRLAATLEETVRGERHACLRYFCSPHHTQSALYPVITQLERAARIEREDDADARLDKLEALLRPSSASLAEDMPLFAALLGIPGGSRYPIPSATPQRLKERTLNALLAQLRQLAARQPMLMVFEDLHWIDPTSLELLSLVIEKMQNQRLLLLATARPEFTPPWPSHRHISAMALPRLDQAEAAAVVAGITGNKEMPPAVLDQIFTRTDGVPLFIEELTKALLESGMLREGESRFELVGPLPLTIPATLHASLIARLDRVATVKEVAQIGSVIGREFPHALIAVVAALPERDLQAALQQLVGAELIFQRGMPPNATYSFKHALVQDAAYASLVRARRQQLHADVARALEAQFAEVVAREPEVLAHHFTAAGLAEQAVHYWQRAGQQASDRSAYLEATTHFKTGIELVNTLPDSPARTQQALTLHIALGAALIALKGHAASEVEEVYLKARALCERMGETPELFPVLFGLWRFCVTRPKLQTAWELGDALLRLAENANNPALGVIAHYAAGFSRYQAGEFVEARRHQEEGIALYAPEQRRLPVFRIAQDPGVACRSYSALSLWLLGFPDQALVRGENGLALALQLKHPFSVGYARCWLAWTCQFRRDAAYACKQADAAVELATEQGFTLWAAKGTIHRGWALAMLGKSREGLLDLEEGITAWRATGAAATLPFYYAMKAEAFALQGNTRDGLKRLEEAYTLVEQTADRWWEAEIHRLRGVLLLQQSKEKHGEAEAWLRRALDVARRQQAKSLELRAATRLARLWRDQGKPAEARKLLEPVYCWFTEGFETLDLKEARTLLDHLMGKQRRQRV
jgi:DNA-binding winged helix-turn-helix (wHTH) protein/predicted ATPase